MKTVVALLLLAGTTAGQATVPPSDFNRKFCGQTNEYIWEINFDRMRAERRDIRTNKTVEVMSVEALLKRFPHCPITE